MQLFDRLRYLFWWLPFGCVPEISAVELNRRLAEEPRPQLVDVRTHVEYRGGHIGGAVNVPLQELRRRIPSIGLDPARPIIAICRSAHRSIPAVRLLQTRGFADAVQLQGGMQAWWREDFPCVSENGAD